MWLKTETTITFAHRKKNAGTASCPSDLLMLSLLIILWISLGLVNAKKKDETTCLLRHLT